MVAAIATSLDPEIFQVQVATIGPPGPMGEDLAREGRPVISLGLDIRRTPAWRILRAVRGLLRELQPDILHTHLYHPNLYGRLASLGLGLKGVVATVHNLYKRVKFHRCLLNRLLARVSDYVVVFSPQVRLDVLCYDAVPPGRIRVVSPGVPIKNLRVPGKRRRGPGAFGDQGILPGHGIPPGGAKGTRISAGGVGTDTS